MSVYIDKKIVVQISGDDAAALRTLAEWAYEYNIKNACECSNRIPKVSTRFNSKVGDEVIQAERLIDRILKNI